MKKLIVEPKMAQPVEPNEESVDPQLNRLKGAKKPSLYSRTVVQLVNIKQEPVDPHLNRSRSGKGRGRGPTVTYKALNANG